MLTFILFSCHAQRKLPEAGKNFEFDVQKDPYLNQITRKINDSIKQSSHIVVVWEPYLITVAGNGTTKFAAIVYSVDDKKKYFLSNKDINRYSVKITPKTVGFATMDYILDYYLNGKIGFLKSIQSHINDGGGFTYICDIDFKAKESEIYKLESILLDDYGKPTSFKKMMVH